jgi:hypothetical protein
MVGRSCVTTRRGSLKCQVASLRIKICRNGSCRRPREVREPPVSHTNIRARRRTLLESAAASPRPRRAGITWDGTRAQRAMWRRSPARQRVSSSTRRTHIDARRDDWGARPRFSALSLASATARRAFQAIRLSRKPRSGLRVRDHRGSPPDPPEVGSVRICRRNFHERPLVTVGVGAEWTGRPRPRCRLATLVGWFAPACAFVPGVLPSPVVGLRRCSRDTGRRRQGVVGRRRSSPCRRSR